MDKPKLIKVKPGAGKIVREPKNGQIVPEAGLKVRLDKYWRRRLADGDVTLIEENKPKRKRPSKKAAIKETMTKNNETKNVGDENDGY